MKTKEIAQKVAEKIAAKAQDKADKAAEDAEKAEIDAQAAIADAADKQAQAEIEAENARELKRYVEDKANASNVSETDTESQLIIGLPENRDVWKNREWGIYTVRSLMYHVDIMDVDDVGGADFINIKCLGRTAEWAEKWLSKGSKVEVTGKIKTGHYTKDDREVYYTELLASSLDFGESKAEAEARQGSQQAAVDEGGFMSIPDGVDDELPFS